MISLMPSDTLIATENFLFFAFSRLLIIWISHFNIFSLILTILVSFFNFADKLLGLSVALD